MKKGARLGWILAVAVFLAAAFWQPDRTLQGASEGLLLWYTKVLPVQFPFVTGARLWLRLGVQERLGTRLEPVMRRVFRLPGCAGGVWAAGLLAGYPSGAFFAAKLYEEGRMTDSETLTLTLLSNTAGPLFVAAAQRAHGMVPAGHSLDQRHSDGLAEPTGENSGSGGQPESGAAR